MLALMTQYRITWSLAGHVRLEVPLFCKLYAALLTSKTHRLFVTVLFNGVKMRRRCKFGGVNLREGVFLRCIFEVYF